MDSENDRKFSGWGNGVLLGWEEAIVFLPMWYGCFEVPAYFWTLHLEFVNFSNTDSSRVVN